jgi:hypothetical protein
VNRSLLCYAPGLRESTLGGIARAWLPENTVILPESGSRNVHIYDGASRYSVE